MTALLQYYSCIMQYNTHYIEPPPPPSLSFYTNTYAHMHAAFNVLTIVEVWVVTASVGMM